MNMIWNFIKKINKLENIKDIIISDSQKEIAEKLINNSIEKPLEWHMTNLQNNNLSLKKIK